VCGAAAGGATTEDVIEDGTELAALAAGVGVAAGADGADPVLSDCRTLLSSDVTSAYDVVCDLSSSSNGLNEVSTVASCASRRDPGLMTSIDAMDGGNGRWREANVRS